eukprot:7211338-Pyramimonas_sp.AAC.1
MVLAGPPRPRCKAAVCWEGITVPVATFIHACTSRANSQKRCVTGGVPVEANSARVVCTTLRASNSASDGDPEHAKNSHAQPLAS